MSVKVNKKRLLNLTFFTENLLDTRASLTTFKEDPKALNEEIRNTLNKCWMNQDVDGGIQNPDNESGIKINCVKQIVAGHIWVKPINTKYGEAIMEVKLKEMREKVNEQKQWQECVEVDMTILFEEQEKEKIEPIQIAEYILVIRKLWDDVLKKSFH